MARSIFRRRVRNAPDQVEDRAAASGDAPGTEDTTAADDDVVAWLDLPPDFTAPDADGAAYRRSNTFELDPAEDAADEAKWAAYMAED